MESLEELRSLVDIISKYRLPREQLLFMNGEAFVNAKVFLESLGGVEAISPVKLVFGGEEKDLDVLKIHYGGCVFDIIKY